MGCFEGNTAETTTLVPIITGFAARHELGNTPMVIAADAGMLSALNLAALDEAGLGFIVGSRMTKAPGDLESHFHWHGDVFTTGRSSTPSLRGTPTASSTMWRTGLSRSGIPTITPTRGGRSGRTQPNGHAATRKRSTPRKLVRGPWSTANAPPSPPGSSRPGPGPRSRRSILGARAIAGRSQGYVTNVPSTVMPAGEVIAHYHELWRVERSFRMSKSDLRARPMFHRTRDAIEAHLTIVVTALAVAHNIQERTGLAIAKVVKQLRPLRSATIAINGTTETFPPEVPEPQRQILTSLNIPEPGH
ncbi:IS1634 family transposase [Mycolicibacterium agri]|uniref:IS1634 family transposase n=1 Tax=Mycolicibacterium agri TaxID=36811 RepID=UPI0013D44980|nr:transposase [Mycolicibacterium agri]